jgi:outer membrane protein assembly factor BamE
MIKLPLLVGFLGSLLLLQGCSSFNNASEQAANALTPYQSDIVQGNVVTREQFELLQVGMSRQQVRNILGTALLTSVFHADRWDYVFTLKRQGIPSQIRKVQVFFKNDVLERTESDPLPTESEFVATLRK